MKTKKVEISLISIYSTYRRYSRGILSRKIDEKENHDIVPLKRWHRTKNILFAKKKTFYLDEHLLFIKDMYTKEIL